MAATLEEKDCAAQMCRTAYFSHFTFFIKGGHNLEHERRAMRVGIFAISLAVLWKVLTGGALAPVISFLQKPSTAAFLLSMETGRMARPPAAEVATIPGTTAATTPSTVPPTETPTEPPPAQPVFSETDGQLVKLYDMCGYQVDLSALLTQSLTWNLTGDSPTVLILHTHATESYTQTGKQYTESSAFRTLDPEYNMLRIGDAVAEALESHGIGVIHDRTLHDHPSYNGAYNASRQSAVSLLKQYPSIRLILDIHRDAMEYSDGSQMHTTATVEGKESAQLMVVVGTNKSGLNHPNWQENMALAAKLHVQLEKTWPGLMRPINFRTERFNQDLLPGSLLIEVGAAGDSLDQALVAAEALAQGIAALATGANGA